MDGDMRLKGSRARFLGAAGLTGAAIATGAWKTGTVGAASTPADPREFNTGRFGIDLGNGWEALVKSVDGGDIVGEVVHEANSAPYYQKKHIGNVKYEEVSFKIGLPSKGVYDWLTGTLAGLNTRKTFWLSTLDANFAEVARRQFNNALISEVGFPALDGSSKDAAYMTIKITPESIEDRPASGKVVTLDASKQKVWLQSNFRLELKNVPTARVSKIEAFTIKQTMVTDVIGEEKEPGKLGFSNVVALVSSADAPSWQAWHKDFVINGNNGEAAEQSGAIVLLDPFLKEIARVELGHVGIFKVSPERSEPNADSISRIKAELYVETMKFVMPA